MLILFLIVEKLAWTICTQVRSLLGCDNLTSVYPGAEGVLVRRVPVLLLLSRWDLHKDDMFTSSCDNFSSCYPGAADRCAGGWGGSPSGCWLHSRMYKFDSAPCSSLPWRTASEGTSILSVWCCLSRQRGALYRTCTYWISWLWGKDHLDLDLGRIFIKL